MGSRRAAPPWLSPLEPGRSRRRTRPRAHLLASPAVAAALLAAVELDVVSELVAGAAGLLLAAVTVLARRPF
jgi:hypothetical protein